MSDGILVGAIAVGLASTAPVLMAATGELLSEKAGSYNIGIEGLMLAGALGGVIGTVQTGSWVLGILAGGVLAAIISVGFAIGVILLRTDMIVTGIALHLAALGLTALLGVDYVRADGLPSIPVVHIPVLTDIPGVGKAVFNQNVMTYIAFALALGAMFMVNRTRHGMRVAAVGEAPEAADASGLNVVGIRFAYIVVGGLFAGFGGATLSLGIIGTWLTNVTAGQGWIAFAVVFFSAWRPGLIILGALLFGALSTLGAVGQSLGWPVPIQVFTALPYLGTIAIMVLQAWRSKARGEVAWPEGLGVPFFRH